MSKTVWVAVSVVAEVKFPRHRDAMQVLRRVDVPIAIHGIEESAAPVALVAHFENMPDGLAWRLHDGDLWRPLIGTDGHSIMKDANVLHDAPRDADWMRHAHGIWNDNPFGPAFWGGKIRSSANPANDTHIDELQGAKLISSNRESVVAEAQRFAAEDLLEIGGILHRRSTPPVWAVCHNGRPPMYSGNVELVLPDIYPFDAGVVRFGPFEKDVAVVCMGAMREVAERYRPLLGEVGEQTPLRIGQTVVERFVDFDEPDYAIRSVEEAWKQIADIFEVVELKQIPFDFLSQYTRLGMAALKGDGKDRDSRLDEVADAARAMLDSFPEPYWKWPRLSDALGMLEAILAHNSAMKPENENDLDAIAFAV